MTTLAKIIVTTLLSLLLFSCKFDMNFSPGVRGNGNVMTVERIVEQSFSKIKVSEGLSVSLSQGNTESIAVEADENLHELIITEVIDDVLKIHLKENIGRAESKKVLVSFINVSEITSSSGSHIFGANAISSDHLKLKTSSGSSMKLELTSTSVDCSSSSGSSMRLSGNTDKLSAKASSGSHINAPNLNALSSNVKASSGAGITINTTKELTADASSGGNIRYSGKPEKINKTKSSGGSISKR